MPYAHELRRLLTSFVPGDGGRHILGSFALPRPSSPGPKANIVRLVIPPDRWGDRGQNLLWSEVDEAGEVETMVWMPETPQEFEEVRRFWGACQEVDWDAPDIHEVGWNSPTKRGPRDSDDS